MSALDAAIAVLLAAAVLAELAAALGVALMDDALDRLHFVGVGSIVGPCAFAAAVWLRHGLDPSSIKVTLIAALVVLTGPVVSHVTARATVRRTEHSAPGEAPPGVARS